MRFLTSPQFINDFCRGRLKNALLHFGKRNYNSQWNTGFWDYLSQFHEENKNRWIQFIGRELIHCVKSTKQFPSSAWEKFADEYGPESNLTFKECLVHQCSFALFPLDESANNTESQVAQIMLVNGKLRPEVVDHRHHFPGLENLLADDRTKVFLLSSGSEIFVGDSWQLALALADKALREGNSSFSKELAENWLLSGAVSEDKVRHVHLGNKLELNSPRQWLVPAASGREIPDDYKGSGIYLISDLTQAEMHVSGAGTKRREQSEWPQEIDEHHLLVGSNIKAQVASILLTDCPRIILWHSSDEESSIKPANILKSVIEETIGYTCVLKEMFASDIVKSEKILRDFIKSSEARNILFNVTSGNRLMSYAVQAVARLFPHIQLIYREITDEVPNRFKLLSYEQFPPYSGEIIGNIGSRMEVYVDFLYKKDGCETAEEFIKKLNFRHKR